MIVGIDHVMPGDYADADYRPAELIQEMISYWEDGHGDGR